MKTKTLILIALALPFISTFWQDAQPKSSLPEHITSRQGSYTATMKFFEAPGKIAFQVTGTQTNQLICGGLWLEGDLKADMGGTKFHGRSVIGFNPKTKHCSGTWIDSMSSHLMVQSGKLDASGKKLVLKAQVEVKGSGLKPARLETIIVDKNKYEFYMYILGGEKDFLSMKIEYTRK
ncbi:MAG: hypothetical protein ACI97A_003732 [Planctomycetota bacterium]|jgi:hypothetical protein